MYTGAGGVVYKVHEQERVQDTPTRAGHARYLGAGGVLTRHTRAGGAHQTQTHRPHRSNKIHARMHTRNTHAHNHTRTGGVQPIRRHRPSKIGPGQAAGASVCTVRLCVGASACIPRLWCGLRGCVGLHSSATWVHSASLRGWVHSSSMGSLAVQYSSAAGRGGARVDTSCTYGSSSMADEARLGCVRWSFLVEGAFWTRSRIACFEVGASGLGARLLLE